MRKYFRTSVFVCAAAAASLTLCAGAQQSATSHGYIRPLPLAGPNRPSSVPENYVITPFGYFDPACVHAKVEGDRLLPNGHIMHANGQIDAQAATCKSPHYNSKGEVVSRHQAAGTAAHSAIMHPRAADAATNPYTQWDYLDTVELSYDSTYVDNNWAYQGISTYWKVPPAPKTDDGQVVYFFPGFTGESILQPVLGWWGGQWVLNDWNWSSWGDNGDYVEYSAYINVNPGDVIYGSISNNCADGTTPCATWNVVGADLTTGQTTVLGETPLPSPSMATPSWQTPLTYTEAPNWVLPASLETYYAISCDDLPQGGSLTFRDVKIFDVNNTLIQNPAFDYIPPSDPADDPVCNYGWKQKGNDITITYGPIPGKSSKSGRSAPKMPVRR